MAKRKRYSSQIKQEQISRQQLSERITEYGWLPNPISPDLGEDFIVHVYIDQEATGITFHLQEKSVTNLLERKTNDSISYPIRVKDLKYWELFLQPVVLIVWDIKLRDGKWVIIQNLIPQMDTQNPNWRAREDRSSININIPWKNSTDDAGFMDLKRAIGHFYYPLISKGKTLQAQIRFAFPPTTEGRKVTESFENYVKEGTPLTLVGEYIKDFSVSDWWSKWLGNIPLKSLVIELENEPRLYDVALQGISKDKKQSEIVHTELRLIKAGSELMLFNNNHKASPLKCDLEIRFTPNGLSGNATLAPLTNDVNVLDAKHALRFLQTIQGGGRLCLVFPDNGQRLNFKLSPGASNRINNDYADLIDKLVFIQSQTGKFLRIPDRGLSNSDVHIIEELFDIVAKGRVKLSNMIVTLEIKGDTLRQLHNIQKEGKPAPRFRFTMSESSLDLFGEEIALGPSVQVFRGDFAQSLKEFEEEVSTASQEEYMPVIFNNVEVEKSFPNWGNSQLNFNEE